MTCLTRGRAQATGGAGGARHSQRSFLPAEFLEWALPVLSAAWDPRLPGSGDFLRGIGRPPSWLKRGGTLPRSHTNSSLPLARKASGRVPLPPQPELPALMFQKPAQQRTNTTPVSLQSTSPAPRKAWPQRTRGPAVAPVGQELGFGQTRSAELRSRRSHGRHRQPHCMAVAPCLPQVGSSPHSPRLQKSSSVSAPGWHRNSLGSKADSGVTASLACFNRFPRLHVWGYREQPVGPHFASVTLEHETPNLLFFFMPLAQHPIGVQTHPLGLPRIQA